MSTPISLQKIIRKKFRARSKSSENFKQLVEDGVENFESSVYAEVGASPGDHILTDVSDCNGLDIETWSNSIAYKNNGAYYKLGPAQALREDIKTKVEKDTKNTIQESYENLNAYMVRCLTNEFPEESPRALLRDPQTGFQRNASDFRWAGDVAGQIAVGRNKHIIMKLTRNILGNASAFVDYFTPIKNNIVIKFIPSRKLIEGQEIYVDVKGNKIIPKDNFKEEGVL